MADNQCVTNYIGRVRSPYRQKFGIPRQSGLVPEAEGWVDMLPPFDRPELFSGLEGFSHIWVVFIFHGVRRQGWRTRVRPPRLGGNVTRGVFASRSPFRPNHIGLSALELLEVHTTGSVALRVRGLDLLDGTPVLDIKPYLPYADSLSHASGGYAQQAPTQRLRVDFSPQATAAIAQQQDPAGLASLIQATLALDPRPAYRRVNADDGVFGLMLADFDVRFRVCDGLAEVFALNPMSRVP